MKDKLIKSVIIARSGVYKYRAEELFKLGLDFNTAPVKKDFYNVYRPALVLANDKDKLMMLPLTNRHPEVEVDNKTFQELAIGFTGETVEAQWNKELYEVVLCSKVALVDQQALENYYVGIDEVSPGYKAIFKWNNGITEKGEPYDIVMTQIVSGNHLAMTPKARGGSGVCITDSQEGVKPMNKFFTALWHNAKKIALGVKDSDEGKFRSIGNEIAEKKDTLKDEEVKSKIGEMQSMTKDLPESDNKQLVEKYLQDLPVIKERTPEEAKAAVGKIADMFEKLDTEAMKEGESKDDDDDTKDDDDDLESEETSGKDPTKTATEAAKAGTTITTTDKIRIGDDDDDCGDDKMKDDTKDDDETEEEKKKEEVKDDEMTGQYVIEELKKFIEKMSGAPKDDESEKTETEKGTEQTAGKPKDDDDDDDEEEKKKEEKKTTTDSMYDVSLVGNKKQNSGLNEFFNSRVKRLGGK